MSNDHTYLRLVLPEVIANDLVANGVAEESIEVRNAADVLSIMVDGINGAAAVVAVVTGTVATGKFARKLIDRARRSRQADAHITVRLLCAGRVVEMTITDNSDASVAKLTEAIKREIKDWPT